MSLLRELAKAGLAIAISAKAEDAARDLRRSARRTHAGLGRELRYDLADVAEEISEDPGPLVRALEAEWDRSRRDPDQRGANW
jgi:hypothetical protein